MVSSVSINNSPVLWRDAGASKAVVSPSENDEAEGIRSQLTERLPRVLEMGGTELLERKLARRTQQVYMQEELDLHNRKAINAYQSLASGEERDVVSEMLGIDVYA